MLGVLPGIIGLVQATEALKLILNAGEPLIGRLLMYDSLGMHFREFRTSKDPECAICSAKATIKELEKSHGGEACAIRPASVPAPVAAASVTATNSGGCAT